MKDLICITDVIRSLNGVRRIEYVKEESLLGGYISGDCECPKGVVPFCMNLPEFVDFSTRDDVVMMVNRLIQTGTIRR